MCCGASCAAACRRAPRGHRFDLEGAGEVGRGPQCVSPAGSDRGRRLIAPRGAQTRPTAAKVREAIFNILGPPPGPVLDLYAGTGALGLEALSRGAAAAVFVERDARRWSALRRNLREAGPRRPRARVIGADVRGALRRLAARRRALLLGLPRSALRQGDRGRPGRAVGRRPPDRLRGRHRRARPAPSAARLGRLPVPDRPPPVRRHRAVVLSACSRVADRTAGSADARRLPGDVRPDHERPRRHPAPRR